MSELSRTILAGGRQVVDANRSLAAVRARNKRDKADAFKQVGLAAKGVGDTLKKHGDWKAAKASEEGVRSVYEADALGRAANGAEGALVGLNAMRAGDAETARVLHGLTAKATKEVQDRDQRELDAAWDHKVEADRQKRWDAEMAWEKEKEGGRVAQKRAELRREAVAERKEEADTRRKQGRMDRMGAEFVKRLKAGTARLTDAYQMATVSGEFDRGAYLSALSQINEHTVLNPGEEQEAVADILRSFGHEPIAGVDTFEKALKYIQEKRMGEPDKGPAPGSSADDKAYLKARDDELKRAMTKLDKLEGVDPDDRMDYDAQSGGEGSYDKMLDDARMEVLYRKAMINFARRKRGLQHVHPEALRENMSGAERRAMVERAGQ